MLIEDQIRKHRERRSRRCLIQASVRAEETYLRCRRDLCAVDSGIECNSFYHSIKIGIGGRD